MLIIDGISSSYDQVRVLSGVSLNIKEGEVLGLLGRNGAGKSTLLNCLTQSDDDALVADRLFATLDPITRALQLPGGERIFVSDTVGFVRNLPHHLVEAFKTTLDVVAEADLLVHVVDGSNPDAGKDIAAVRTVLAEIGAAELPELIRSEALSYTQLRAHETREDRV